MTDPTPAEALKAGEIVEALFADLRSRKFLKYLFDEEPNSCGAYGYIDSPFDPGIQQEIADDWRALVVAALCRPPPDAGEVRTYREGVASEWQEIETAPKDGTQVLLFGIWPPFDILPGGEDCIVIASWSSYSSSADAQKEWIGASHYRVDFTHWRPLPAPPAAAIRKLP